MTISDDQLESLVYKARERMMSTESRNPYFDRIIQELAPEIKKYATQYYINGADSEDTFQEACLGILKAIEDWKKHEGTSFRNFAMNICCKRHILTEMSAANRQKFKILNNSLSLSTPIVSSDDDNEQYLADFIPDTEKGPEDLMIAREQYDILFKKIFNKLTDLEKDVLIEYLQGQSYKEIAANLKQKPKAVDNALMRIRNKATTCNFD